MKEIYLGLMLDIAIYNYENKQTKKEIHIANASQ